MVGSFLEDCLRHGVCSTLTQGRLSALNHVWPNMLQQPRIKSGLFLRCARSHTRIAVAQKRIYEILTYEILTYEIFDSNILVRTRITGN